MDRTIILTHTCYLLDPFHGQSVSFSSSFNIFLLSTYCPLVFKCVHKFPVFKKKKYFSWPWNNLTRLFYLFPSFSSKFLKSVVCLCVFHFLTTDSLLPHLQAGFHQYPFTKNVFPRSPVAFSPPNLSRVFFPTSPHSPLPFNNLGHQSPGPMFLLGNISYVYSFLSIFNVRTLERPFSSTYLCSLLSLSLVHGHHVNLYKTLISHHFLIQ